MSGNKTEIDFDAPAVLRKWPSINGKPVQHVLWPNPYLVFDGRLGECIDQFLAKPVSQRPLYQIHTDAQSDMVGTVMSSEQIAELARQRESVVNGKAG